MVELDTALSYLETRISQVYDKIIYSQIKEKDLHSVRLHIQNIKAGRIVESPKEANSIVVQFPPRDRGRVERNN